MTTRSQSSRAFLNGSVDPIDDSAIWMAHQYANARHKNSGNGNYSIWVGKFVF